MPIEQPRSQNNPASIEQGRDIQDQITVLWNLLPESQQAIFALTLISWLMEGEQKHQFREAIDERWPVTTDTIYATFGLIQLTRQDLIRAHFNGAEISLLSDEDLTTIAQTMRDHYVHDVFWPELEYVTTAVLEEKRPSIIERHKETTAKDADFYNWMSEIDSHVWSIVGCSVYDLPDAQFRDHFNAGLDTAEVVNTLLAGSGLNYTD